VGSVHGGWEEKGKKESEPVKTSINHGKPCVRNGTILFNNDRAKDRARAISAGPSPSSGRANLF
jgi:hypothetical protein